MTGRRTVQTLVAAIALLLPPLAEAALITVTTTADVVANDGQCSLREAVQAANTNAAHMNCPAGSSSDSILLGSGTYTLTRTGANEDANLTGDLDVTQRVTILGLGADVAIVASHSDRIFDLLPSTTIFELVDVDLIGGRAPASEGGGAIRAFASTRVSISGSRLYDNQAGAGGAVALVAPAQQTPGSQPWLRIVDSTFAANQAAQGGAVFVSAALGGAEAVFERTTFQNNHAVPTVANPEGGALWAGWNGTSGQPLQVSVIDSWFLDNRAQLPLGTGGAILAQNSAVMIDDTDFSRNEAGSMGGGAIRVLGASNTLNITDSTFHGNRIPSGSGSGGALLASAGSTVIERSVFQSNRCRSSGGAILGGGEIILRQSELTGNGCPTSGGTAGGGVALSSGVLRVERSVLRNNSAEYGGGLWVDGEEVVVDRSLLYGNRVERNGGGLYVAAATKVELLSSTFSANTAASGGGIALATGVTGILFNNLTVALNEANSGWAGDGGGLWADTGVVPMVANSILARNGDRSASPASQHQDCSGTLQSAGYNLIGIDSGCTITGVTTGNLVGTQSAPVHPHLRPRETFSGMPVHRLLFTSPAVDAGAPGPATGYPNCAPLDQLNQARPLDGDGVGGARCDIGAVDWAGISVLPIFLDDFESGNTLLW